MDAVQIERSSESKQTLTAVGLTLAAMISIQLGAAISKPIMQQLGTFGTTFVRLSFAAIILLIWIRPSFRSYNRSQWLSAFSLGASMAFMTMCFFAAIETIPLGLAGRHTLWQRQISPHLPDDCRSRDYLSHLWQQPLGQ